MGKLPKAILFDMDGTITEPMLDFPTIKREMGIGNRPILEALAEMSTEERQRAEAVLHRHEENAAANSTLNAGCKEMLAWLHRHSIAVAVITRNSRLSTDRVIERHRLAIEVTVTREDAPPKPESIRISAGRDGRDIDRNRQKVRRRRRRRAPPLRADVPCGRHDR